jgi:hypothetical protein
MLRWLDHLLLSFSFSTPFIVVTDWNDTVAPAFRKGVNQFVPCFFQAFPPYQQQHLDSSTCPVAQFTSADQRILDIRPDGFYKNSNILNCDSYLGVIFFVASATLLVYAILGYYYIFHSFISLVSAEFKDSKFVDILEKLIRIREDEEISYNVRLYLLLFFYFAPVFHLCVK